MISWCGWLRRVGGVTESGRAFTIPNDPADRLRKVRQTVRVIMIAGERTLLFEDSDPGIEGSRWWVTPGGGIDPGETEGMAAVREVAEETGYVLGEDELIGPVARRRVIHGYSDQIITQDEAFYLARVEDFDVDISAHTEDERLTLLQHRWWARSELAETDAPIWPAELLELWDLIEASGRWPVALGEREESTVPVE
jgi:8-oxo-dGTP pyrophosphatase MutT (NUDIX family)